MKSKLFPLIIPISLLVLSMYPIHALPPVLSSQDFIAYMNVSDGILQFYNVAFYIGFVMFAALLVVLRRPISLNRAYLNVVGGLWLMSFLVAFSNEPNIALLGRVMLGACSFLLYAYCFQVIFSFHSGIGAYSSVFAISTIFLDSSALLNGVASDGVVTGESYPMLITLPLIFFIATVTTFWRKVPSTTDLSTMITFTSVFQNARKTFPSICVNVAFFLFLGLLSQPKFHQFSSIIIGICIFSLSIAFPLGAKVCVPVFNRMGPSMTVVLFTGVAVLGILLVNFSLVSNNSYLLVVATMVMAFGNAGILISNTFSASTDKAKVTEEPQIAYMVFTAFVTASMSMLFPFIEIQPEFLGLIISTLYLMVFAKSVKASFNNKIKKGI